MDLRHIWQILWKRKWLVIQSFVVVTLIAVVGSEFAPEIYQTESKVWVPEETGESTLLTLFGLKALSSIYPRRVPLREEMKNRHIMATLLPVYEDVVWKLQLRQSNGDLMPGQSIKSGGAVFKLHPRPYVRVEMMRDTSFLNIMAWSTDAEEAQMLANAMADSYMERSKMMLRDEARAGRAFVDRQIGEVSESYDMTLDDYREFQQREGTVNLPMETQIAIRRVTDLIRDRERTILQLGEAEAKVTEGRAQLDAQTLALWAEASGTTSGDPELTRLTVQWTTRKTRLRQALIERTENHPIIDILKQEVEVAEIELRDRLELYEVFSPLLIALKREISSLQAHLEGVEKDIEAHMEALEQLPDKTLEEARLKLKTGSYEAIYRSLLDYDKQLGLAEVISVEDVKVVEKANLPKTPLFPSKSNNRNMGMLFGLLIGVALAFLVEHLDDRFIVPEDVREREDLPLLGVIPVIRSRPIASFDKKGRVFESYRAVRHNLRSVLGGRSPRSVSILSAASGEGRSVTAANLALSLCGEGKRVLLLDADLREPSQHRLFGVERAPGVVDVIGGTASVDAALRDTGIDGLTLLPCGEPTDDPAAVVESKEMARLLEEMEGRFDVVVVDTPPLLCVADGAVLAGMMGTSVLVYQSRRTTEKMASAAKERLQRARVVPSGVVLNRYKPDRLAFRSYGYEES